MSDKIEALIKKISKQPRNDIVAELIGKGDIDSLTQFRLKLVEKGKQFETFPKGDLILEENRKDAASSRPWKNVWQMIFVKYTSTLIPGLSQWG